MANINKPNMTNLWASAGAIIAPSDSKVQQGWTAEIPPHQWENYVQNRQDNAIAYLFQHGIPEWDATTEYQAGKSFIQNAGSFWKALTTNINITPVEGSDWTSVGLTTAAADARYAALAGLSTQTFSVANATAGTHAMSRNASDARYSLLGSAASIQGLSKNLIASATGANASILITSDEFIAESNTNAYITLRSVNVTINFNSSGANGLDTGSKTINTWYYGHVIWNGTTIAGLGSLSATAPTMPSGYTYAGLATVGRTDASGNVKIYWQSQSDVFIADTNVFTAQAASAANTYQTFNAAAFVPPIAKSISGTLGCVAGNNGVISIAGDASGLGAQQHNAPSATAFDGFNTASSFVNIPLKTSQNFFWKSFDTAARNRVNISQFKI